jgi:hypothetical protein
MKKPSRNGQAEAQSMLTHWQEAVPNDRLAHLVKDVTRAFIRALQARLTRHGVSFGHWTFLRVLGNRWTHTARADRPGRRHGADHLRRHQGDGEAWLCGARAATGNRHKVYSGKDRVMLHEHTLVLHELLHHRQQPSSPRQEAVTGIRLASTWGRWFRIGAMPALPNGVAR